MKVTQANNDINIPRYALLKVFCSNSATRICHIKSNTTRKELTKQNRKANIHDPVRNPARSFDWLE